MKNIERIKEAKLAKLFDVVRTEKDIYATDLLVPFEDFPGTYYFPDVDYTDKSRAVWKPSQHLARIQRELALGGKERIKTDTEWRNKLLGAFDYWLKNDFTSDNWWYNQIATPSTLLCISLMTDEYLTEDMRAKIEEIALRGSFKAHVMLGMTTFPGLPKNNGTPDNWRAANLMWGATTTVYHALFTNDEALLHIASERIGKELCYSYTGIQEDGAFVQHGRRWYSAGYGAVFVGEITPLINMLGGTEFAISDEKIDILLTHVLDGQRHMHRNGIFDFNARGRDYSRRSGYAPGSYARTIKLLSETPGIKRADELREYYTAISGGEDTYESTVYYPSIAQLCHKKDGVYIGIRGRSEGILGAEHCNNEGILSYNMSYGTITCFMENGLEYANISALYDFAKIPGTTARDENDEEIFAHPGWSETVETECRAAGITKDGYGILTERAVHDGISLKASFFTFGSCMVALGADIFDERGETLTTTVEQCNPNSPEINGGTIRNGKVYYKTLDEDKPLVAEVRARVGSWRRNNLSSSDAEVTGEMFTVTIPTKTGDTYAYAVYTNDEPNVSVLKNDAACQAILVDGEELMAVFHEDFELRAFGKTFIGKAGELLITEI